MVALTYIFFLLLLIYLRAFFLLQKEIQNNTTSTDGPGVSLYLLHEQGILDKVEPADMGCNGEEALDTTGGAAAGRGKDTCHFAEGPTEIDHRLICFKLRTSSRFTSSIARRSSFFW